MGRLGKIGVALIAVAGLVAVAVVIVPFALADRLWQEAAARAGAATGLRITAEGSVRLKLFPAPRLLVSTVEIASAPGAALAHIDRAKLELTWADLLTGHADAKRVQLRHARLLLLPQHPPVDLDIERDGETARLTASYEGGVVRAGIRAGAAAVAIEALDVLAGAYVASGTGQLTLGNDPRVVVTFDRLEHAGIAIGRGGVAATLASDSLVIERVFLQGNDGAEASFFGLAVADHGAVRLEGGLEGRAATPAGAVEATARLAASLGGATGRIDITDIELRSPGTRLSGSLRAELALESRLQGDFRIDALDLDATPAKALGVLAPLAAIPTAELRLRIGRLTWKSMAADGVVIDMIRQGPQVTLRELAARNIGGAPFYAQGRFGLAPSGLAADAVNFRYATLDGTLNGSVDLSGNVPLARIDAVLNGPLALDAIVPPLPPLPPEPTTRRAAAAAAVAAAAPRPPASSTGWSRERFSLPALPEVEADLRLTTPRLIWRGHRLEAAEMKARIADSVFTLETLTGRLYDGRFELQGRAAVTEGRPVFSGTVSLAGSDLKAVLRDYAGINEIAGSVDGTAQLAATGSSAAELMAGLKGTAQIRCRDGAITGFNLPGMSDGLKRIQRPTDLAEVFRLGMGGGRTTFSALEGGFRIDQGVARTENLKLVAKGGEIRTVGTINLAAWTVDIGNQFRLTEHPELPPFALKLNGPMDAPRRIFEFQELQSQLVRRGRPAVR
jgi:hypothetical protein